MKLLKYKEFSLLKEQSNEDITLQALQGNLDAVKRYVESGGDIDVQNSFGMTMLMRACLNAHLDVVKYLVEHGASLEVMYGDETITALEEACFSNEKPQTLALIQYLLEEGAVVYESTLKIARDRALSHSILKLLNNSKEIQLAKKLDINNANKTVKNSGIF